MSLHFKAIVTAALLVLAAGSREDARAQSPDTDELEFYRTSNLTPLYGEQDGTMEKGAYVAIDDIVVRKGMTLSFQPGATVALKKDKKILVAGKLTCDGSPRGTVTFTRLRNDQYYIPLDPSVDGRWDGIFLADSAELEMRYSNILDSKYGIEVKPNFTRILLDTVLFRNNKVQNLKLGDRTIRLTSGKYLSFQAPEVKKAEQKWKPGLRITCGGLAIVGAGLAIYGFARSDALGRQYDVADSTTATGLRESSTGHFALGWIGAGLGILGSVGFAVTFAF